MQIGQTTKGCGAAGATEDQSSAGRSPGGAECGGPGGDPGFDRVLEESGSRRAGEQGPRNGERDSQRVDEGEAGRDERIGPASGGAGPGPSIRPEGTVGGPLKRGRGQAELREEGSASLDKGCGHRMVGPAQTTVAAGRGSGPGLEDVPGGFSVHGVRGCEGMGQVAAMRSGVSARGLHAVQVDLNLPELGEAMLQVELSAEGAVAVTLRIADGAGRAGLLLEELERVLKQQGLSVESAEVKNGSKEDSGGQRGRFGQEAGVVPGLQSVDRSERQRLARLRRILPVLAGTFGTPGTSGSFGSFGPVDRRFVGGPEGSRGAVVDFLT